MGKNKNGIQLFARLGYLGKYHKIRGLVRGPESKMPQKLNMF
jgi:hypothetical protein